MKKVMFMTMLIFFLFSITACSNNKDNTYYMGVNAEILEISKYVKGIVVKGLDNNSILGKECYINCENSDIYLIYVDNTSREVTEIRFGDLMVGDQISVDVESVENKYVSPSQIQLLTQRK